MIVANLHYLEHQPICVFKFGSERSFSLRCLSSDSCAAWQIGLLSPIIWRDKTTVPKTNSYRVDTWSSRVGVDVINYFVPFTSGLLL